MNLANQEKFHKECDKQYWKAIAELIPREVPNIDKKRAKRDPDKKPSVTVIQGPKPGKPTDLTRMRQIFVKLKHNPPAHMIPPPSPKKASKDGKDAKDGKDNKKEEKDSKDGKEDKDSKESKEDKDGKEGKDRKSTTPTAPKTPAPASSAKDDTGNGNSEPPKPEPLAKSGTPAKDDAGGIKEAAETQPEPVLEPKPEQKPEAAPAAAE